MKDEVFDLIEFQKKRKIIKLEGQKKKKKHKGTSLFSFQGLKNSPIKNEMMVDAVEDNILFNISLESAKTI